MAKKQKSFADKAAGNTSGDSVYVKYVKSVQSEETGRWRFNEQMIRMNKGEQLDAALKRMDEVANLVDIDLSEFAESEKVDTEVSSEHQSEETVISDNNEVLDDQELQPNVEVEDKEPVSEEADSSVEEEE
jgi:small nuclear ribonucleoprotein (snRNP)-like protein